MLKIKNPLTSTKKPEFVHAGQEPVTAGAVSPISKKPMRKVLCGTIEAYFDQDNKLVLPMSQG